MTHYLNSAQILLRKAETSHHILQVFRSIWLFTHGTAPGLYGIVQNRIISHVEHILLLKNVISGELSQDN